MPSKSNASGDLVPDFPQGAALAFMSESPAEPSPIIRVEGFTAAYGGDVVIDDIDFTVERGSVFVVLGGSGCGKSTLLKHLIGLYPPAKGRIWIDSLELTSGDPAARDRILKRIGVMYQSGALFGSMTLRENIMLPLEEFTALPEDARQSIAAVKLALVGLTGYEEHFPSEISGGMQKRAAIARAMALDPAVVFLDEPSAGLDPITSAALDKLILNLRDSLGTTFVIVSHELASIFTVADQVIMLDKSVKKIIARGDPRELKAHSDDPLVIRFFNRDGTGDGTGDAAGDGAGPRDQPHAAPHKTPDAGT